MARFYTAAKALLAAAALMLAGLRPSSGGGYDGLAAGIAASAAEQGANRFAVAEFSAQGEAAPEEAAEAQRLLSEALFKLQGIGVMDAAVLQKITGRGRAWAQAAIRGSVYRTGETAMLVVKLSPLRQGGREGIFQIELPRQALAPADLRDAPAGNNLAGSCAAKLERLDEQNRAAVDLKARYWAARVRSPGFSYYELKRAPGSELREYATVQRFFESLNAYYEQDAPVTLTAEEISRLKKLTDEEAGVLRECLSRP